MYPSLLVDNRYSELVITHTNTLNSGNYSCVSNNAVAASTLVHILNGKGHLTFFKSGPND